MNELVKLLTALGVVWPFLTVFKFALPVIASLERRNDIVSSCHCYGLLAASCVTCAYILSEIDGFTHCLNFSDFIW